MPDSAGTAIRLAVLGGGNMAEAIVRGVLSSGYLPAERVAVFDPVESRRQVFATLGCRAVAARDDLLPADVVLLATKPQTARDALSGFPLDRNHLLVSIAAGLSTDVLAKCVPDGVRIVRVMPNTPLMVGCGMSALCPGAKAGADDLAVAHALFAGAGDTVVVQEDLMDAVTAVSGSGPAYLFRFAEALIDGGADLGLDRDVATRLVLQTILGSARMLMSGEAPSVLRERVTSPGGTTAAALAVMNDGNFAGLVGRALTAARDRGRELGKA
ncbi:MAG: pyrroline-5-carboxylate reductase [Planctomycetes bacterium]|nr:pyrroline-5-carboxylate reductase [Planctomycetota bacterium]MCD7897557.1 pyrroline-5-carboxylate reductase [Planctomycetaceae bacterium]